MSTFTTPLVVTPLEDGRNWKLIESFIYHIGNLESDEIVSVPAGFETDFASVPKFLWNILPPWGRYGKAAVIHDYCYRKGLFTRKRCDKIFYEGMKVLKVPYWKRNVMYRAVRWFGGKAYKGTLKL